MASRPAIWARRSQAAGGLLAVAALLEAMSAGDAGAQQRTLYAVSTSHLDTQFQWTVQDTISRYLPNTCSGQFALLDAYPDYVFSFEGAFRYQLIKEYYPETYARIGELVASGRWVPVGSSFEAGDVNIPSPESILRHFLYGNDFFEQEFGRRSVDVFLPDSFGFGYALPTIAAHAGLIGFSTQKLSPLWGPAVGIPFAIGLWQGVDGSSLVSALDAGDYTTQIESDWSADRDIRADIDAVGDASGVYVGYRYFGVGDSGGAPSTSSLDWLQTAIHRAPAGVVDLDGARAPVRHAVVAPLVAGQRAGRDLLERDPDEVIDVEGHWQSLAARARPRSGGVLRAWLRGADRSRERPDAPPRWSGRRRHRGCCRKRCPHPRRHRRRCRPQRRRCRGCCGGRRRRRQRQRHQQQLSRRSIQQVRRAGSALGRRPVRAVWPLCAGPLHHPHRDAAGVHRLRYRHRDDPRQVRHRGEQSPGPERVLQDRGRDRGCQPAEPDRVDERYRRALVPFDTDPWSVRGYRHHPDADLLLAQPHPALDGWAVAGADRFLERRAVAVCRETAGRHTRRDVRHPDRDLRGHRRRQLPDVPKSLHRIHGLQPAAQSHQLPGAGQVEQRRRSGHLQEPALHQAGSPDPIRARGQRLFPKAHHRERLLSTSSC
ncbi:MAG: hypothetical protein JXR83_12335 [Deltaproteobacteria bacterium]|nr:hypothetical protein [Deltaproteobacteria bacterium]